MASQPGLCYEESPPFRDYYLDHSKSINVCSLLSLRGRWDRLMDEDALKNAVNHVKMAEFADLLSTIRLYPYVAEPIQEVLPIYIQQEEAKFQSIESTLTAKEAAIQNNLRPGGFSTACNPLS